MQVDATLKSVVEIADVVEQMSIQNSIDIGYAVIHFGEHPELGKVFVVSGIESTGVVLRVSP